MPESEPHPSSNSWVNYADKKDPVALDVRIGDDYEPKDENGVQVVDDLVSNDYHKPDDPEDRNYHKSYGYLRTPEIADHIADFLKS